MIVRRIVATIIVAALIFWAPAPAPSVIPAKAVTISCASAILTPCLPAPSAGLGVGGGIAVGIIATAAVLCIFDIWLKFNGYKNWDGTPKVKVKHP